MQEIKKRRIVLASVLKPVNDARMFEKMAMSLHLAGYNDIHIIGYPSRLTWEINSGITFHPLKTFARLSIRRALASWKILFKAIGLKPALLIVTTHELLFVAIVIKSIIGCRIVYDVRENYYRNIMSTNAFPRFLRYPVATWVSLKEKLLTQFFDAFFIAEQCYQQELSFVAKNTILLENKCVIPKDFKREPSKSGTMLLFTGTLSESTGLFAAIDLAEKLHQIDSSIKLHIVGYCPQGSTLVKLSKIIRDRLFIQLTGGNEIQPHNTILDAIGKADFGIICYPPAPHTRNRVPTKLFEYLACELPILLQNSQHLIALADSVEGAIAVDFDDIDTATIRDKMKQLRFYTRPNDGFSWEKESPRLVNQIQQLLGG